MMFPSIVEGLADSLRRNHYQQQAPLPNYNVQLLPFQFAKPRVSENLPGEFLICILSILTLSTSTFLPFLFLASCPVITLYSII